MDTGIIESCGALIYCNSTKRYLFLLRNTDRYAGTWGLVGGKIEPGESILEAMTREISEELGGFIKDSKLIPIEKFTSDNKRFIYHTFLINVDEEFVPVLNNEHRGYCWVQLEDHPKPLHPGVHRTVNFDSVRDKIATVEEIYKMPTSALAINS